MNKTNPSARIAVNKSVVPIGTNVYLKSGQEFQIELFNPTQYNVLAKIYINGVSISNSGLIIKPGRREWLERYIDNPKKFKFDVYEVDSNNSEVDHAIRNNGAIKIEFYKEQIINNTLILGTDPVYTRYYCAQPNYFASPFVYSTANVGTLNLTGSSTLTTGSNNASYSSDFSTKSLSEQKETGRIEHGSNSEQQFEYTNMDFESFVMSSNEYKLLPISSKPVEISEIKVYCTSCGCKRKKDSYKFCPACGTKF